MTLANEILSYDAITILSSSTKLIIAQRFSFVMSFIPFGKYGMYSTHADVYQESIENNSNNIYTLTITIVKYTYLQS